MIRIGVNIYCDISNLLNEPKINILEEVQKEITQNTDYFNEYIIDELCDYYSDFMELYEQSYLSLSDYISVIENQIRFDLEEAKIFGYTKKIPFLVPCDFDDEKYMKDLREEVLENNNQREENNL